jgi:hypothetical protein
LPPEAAAAAFRLDGPRIVALALGVGLTIATISGLVPGLTDDQGRTFGLFKLNAYQNLLHTASAAWAFTAVAVSRSATVDFLRIFGTLYFLDGAMGVAIGSGYLDLGVVRFGVLNLPLWFKILTSLPHLFLGGMGIAAGFLSKR